MTSCPVVQFEIAKALLEAEEMRADPARAHQAAQHAASNWFLRNKDYVSNRYVMRYIAGFLVLSVCWVAALAPYSLRGDICGPTNTVRHAL